MLATVRARPRRARSFLQSAGRLNASLGSFLRTLEPG
jgi:hypothetical protein